MSQGGYWGSEHRGPYRQVGQVRFHSAGNAVPLKDGGRMPARYNLYVRAVTLEAVWGPTAVASGISSLEAGREIMAFLLPLEEGGTRLRAARRGGGLEK